MTKPALMIGLGEVLRDLLPSGKVLGGAPANFAYMTSVLGNHGVVASRVGNDDLGREACRVMQELGLNTSYVQHDDLHETGTAKVSIDGAGQPNFTIKEQVSWDFLQWTETCEELLAKRLLNECRLRLVCITRGARGSLLVSANETVEHRGFRVKVADAVGAGDAFTACLAHHYLRAHSLQEISESANRFASWVATETGATPRIGADQLRSILNGALH